MRFTTLVLIGFVMLTAPAFAHDAKPLHGGKIVLVGNFHVEMVAKGDTVEIYLVDHHNQPMSAKGYKGLAILSVDGKSQRIVLQETDGARLVGKSEVLLPAQPKGVVQITPSGGKTVQARF